jgi:hypothetical protein
VEVLVVIVVEVNEFVVEVLVTVMDPPPSLFVEVEVVVVSAGGYWAENSFPAAVSTVNRTVPLDGL